MHLNAQQVRNIILSKGVYGLYHANTCRTSQSYLKEGALLSRAYVERNGLVQTAQKSDWTDKKFGLWDDIFFDFVDIHDRGHLPNCYGPVLFKFSPDLLLSIDSVSVTKVNPIYWVDGQLERDRYYLSESEFDTQYMLGNLSAQLILRRIGKLSLLKFIEKIVLDVPPNNFGKTASQIRWELLRYRHYSLSDVPIVFRKCPFNCRCKRSIFSRAQVQKKFGI